MKLAEFARWTIQHSFEGMDADGCDIQDKAAALGVLTQTIYDPEIHGESTCDAEPGCPWFVFSDEFKAALASNRKGHSPQPQTQKNPARLKGPGSSGR